MGASDQESKKASKKKWWFIGCGGLIGLIVIIVVISAIAALSEETSSTSSVQMPGVTREVGSSTPNSKASGDRVMISYSSAIMNRIGAYSDPKPGNVFLVLDMTVQNQGYSSFNTNPYWFSATVNKVKYQWSWASASLDNELENVDVQNGGTVRGKLAFEVPSEVATSGFQIGYEIPFKNYSIEWRTQ